MESWRRVVSSGVVSGAAMVPGAPVLIVVTIRCITAVRLPHQTPAFKGVRLHELRARGAEFRSVFGSERTGQTAALTWLADHPFQVVQLIGDSDALDYDIQAEGLGEVDHRGGCGDAFRVP